MIELVLHERSADRVVESRGQPGATPRGRRTPPGAQSSRATRPLPSHLIAPAGLRAPHVRPPSRRARVPHQGQVRHAAILAVYHGIPRRGRCAAGARRRPGAGERPRPNRAGCRDVPVQRVRRPRPARRRRRSRPGTAVGGRQGRRLRVAARAGPAPQRAAGVREHPEEDTAHLAASDAELDGRNPGVPSGWSMPRAA
jgi:hypothetical protein